jgi:hypothetical protein
MHTKFLFHLFQNRTKKGQVETFTINPKCIKLGELYGETDPNTFEWSDGLIALAMRKFAKDTTSNTQPGQLAVDDSKSVASGAPTSSEVSCYLEDDSSTA